MTDLTVIGGGAAGCRAAALAAKEGFSVSLIESGALGGAAAHEGYWPYRRLLEDAAFLNRARAGDLGSRLNSERHIHTEMLEHMRAYTETMAFQTKENLVSLGVEIVRAPARVGGLRNNRYIVSAGDGVYESRRLLLCMGSVPDLPDLPSVEKARREGFMVTPGELLSARLPMKAVISGGTLRDLCIAAWLAANNVSVVLLSPHERVAAELDADISEWLLRDTGGVRVVTGASLTSVHAGRVTVVEPSGGRTIECDMVVIGGRRFPATRGMGLNEAAIATDNGAVITDMTGRASLPDVYAAGDVNARVCTALGAMREAEVCVANMLGRHQTVPYHAIPHIFGCSVSAASAGETEASARALGYRAAVGVSGVDGEAGLVKLIADADTGRLLGAHLCGGADGAEVIWEFSAALEAGLKTDEIRRALMPRSTFADAAQRALWQLD